ARHSESEARLRVAGWAVLRMVLGREMGQDPRSLVFAFEPSGRPYLVCDPHQANVVFSLSFSGHCAAFAVARGRRVGIDLEKWSDFDFSSVVESQFSLEEIARWRTLPAELRPRAFFGAWTIKEAYVKALGEGLLKPMNSFAVELDPRCSPEILRCDADGDARRRWGVGTYAPSPDYSLAVVAEEPPHQVLTMSYVPIA
ncbi:MAG TPA: 4'-phosphopantetheinyl transferase superfamily protein, partial [Opitutaceae bacterium]